MTRGRLPATPGRFIGRVRELAQIEALVRRARIVTITGPGGSGKSTVALEIARRRARRSSAVFLVDLLAVTDDGSVARQFARALGVTSETSEPLLEATRLLADVSGLVVVDNCEHVLHGAAIAVAQVLERSPRLRMVATSREPLRVSGERSFSLGPLRREDAIRLFTDRAEAARLGAVTSANAAIEAICARLDDLPLALELAAARVSALSPEAILSGLGQHPELLSRAGGSGPARHASVRATVDWSYDLLRARERKAFVRLSAFPASFTLEAASAVADVDVDTLTDLVEKSLVSPVVSRRSTRYRLLDTLRSYGRARSTASAQEDRDLGARFLDFYTERCERAFESAAPAGAEAEVSAMVDEIENVRQATRWSVDHSPGEGLRLAGAAREVWFRQGQSEGLAWTRRLLELCPGRTPARARGLLSAGVLEVGHQSHQAARLLLVECSRLADELRDGPTAASCELYLGTSAMLTRELDAARRHLSASVEQFGVLGLDRGVGRAKGILGAVLYLSGDLLGAREMLSVALESLRPLDDPWGCGQALTYLGLTARATGDELQALAALSDAASQLAPTEDVTILGIALAALATLTVERDPRRAMRMAGAAVGLRERTGGRYPPWTLEDVQSVRRRADPTTGSELEREWEAGRRSDVSEVAAFVAGRQGNNEGGPLTDREFEIARMVAAGLANAQIAGELFLSERTVENHVFHALTKLDMHTRVQLATWVVERSQGGAQRARGGDPRRY